MKYSFVKCALTTAVLSLILFVSEQIVLAANTNELVAQAVDQLCDKLQKSKNPETLFGISKQDLVLNQAYAKWLEPSQFVSSASEKELGDYHGSIAYARIEAPFFRLAQTIVSYDGESKFIPGIKSTKVLTRKRESREKEFILMEREREVPIALKPFILSGSRYKIENTIFQKENKWILVRIQLAKNEKNSKSMMQAIEGFEFAKDLGNGEALVVTGGFALPNLGFLKTRNETAGKLTAPLKAPISKATFGFLDKMTEKLDFKGQVQKLIADSIVEGTFQNAAALIQVTTDERWKSKWAYQLTAEETKALFLDNKELVEKAKKNKQIIFKLK